jgi:precorrin-2 dehydrogenase / sirohydrochlorin ferrochelatase
MSDNRYYMACLDLEGRSVLVVGGGPVALEKAQGLLLAGARITVVAPEIVPELRALDVELVERRYAGTDLEGRFLVVAATADGTVDRAIFEDAERRRIFCNAVDTPELCSLILPSVHRDGPIALAVSTGGASPALAKRIRSELAAQLRPEYPQIARQLRALRPWARRNLATYEERRAYFEDVLERALR